MSVQRAFWEHRTYPGGLAQLRQVRQDLATDLAGFPDETVETLTLCASELFANACKYTASGQENGQVIRTLCLRRGRLLRLGFTDDGGSGRIPAIPVERSDDEWNWAEGQRGLLMVQELSVAWGYDRTCPWTDTGTHTWALIPLPEGTAPPPGLRPYIFTR
ncbi:ATP-binding protein [Nocardiopsis algeriensis]|uniref:Anti-sigma regulatory factor (Ser/Thr protein kinase) n=1 Tax=Nocardiopsis algeriensis TaxID=1478215 RepID=A0A841IP81_9ACTN|nr:ATP-binding protein [Nocardiopsis algeriensis]MBB6118161.1 anti-sigma regulatory factor (Ser/Thr protein kinase) [Nocardiopsis algeriensis]